MDKRELPENIRQAIDLIAAVLRRIKAKELDKRRDECLYIEAKELDKRRDECLYIEKNQGVALT